MTSTNTILTTAIAVSTTAAATNLTIASTATTTHLHSAYIRPNGYWVQASSHYAMQ